MADISAKLVKELRDKTGAGMSDCKKALEEAGGDMQRAEEVLRERGAATAAKRADKDAREGAIVAVQSDDKKTALLLEINCETDFVARSEGFVKFATAVAQLALKHRAASPADVMKLVMDADFDHLPVPNAVEMMVGRVGEKIEVSRVALVENSDGIAVAYIHPGAKLGSIVSLSGINGTSSDPIGKDLAMQVAASSPIALERSQVPQPLVEQEAERLEKFYQDVVLLEQPFIRDNAKTVMDVLHDASTRVKSTLTVRSFVRFQLGER